MRLRVMTEADIAAGMRLKELAGWNQTIEDWQRFLNAGPNGCFVAEVDARVVGTAATICYDDKFAWIGMVLVDPECRGRGVGTRLLERAIELLDEVKIPTIKLDATPLGRPLYEKLGFRVEYEIERVLLTRSADEVPKDRRGSPKTGISKAELEIVAAEDYEVFGADRSALLESLRRAAPELTGAVRRNGELKGYIFGRKGSFADHVGPWAGMEREACRELLAAFLQQSCREAVIVDRVKANEAASGLLREHGFVYSRALTRMYRGQLQVPARNQDLCAILGPEFG